MPLKLDRILSGFDLITDRNERIALLIDMAERFRDVPPRVARRPFPEEHRVPACESEAFVFAEDQPGGGLKLHFAVENPQGVSAKALAVILDEALSGERPEVIATVAPDLVYRLFGRELSMGKSMGLTSMVGLAQTLARRRATTSPGG